MDSDGVAHRIVVVRVEVGDGLLIELLEVGPHRTADRVLGRTDDPARAAQRLETWLRALAGDAAETER